MFTWICWLSFFLRYSAVSIVFDEIETSSECWVCTPHVLSCAGDGVILIFNAQYGYTRDCVGGITKDGCNNTDRERCCDPQAENPSCFIEFNESDRASIERTCANQTTCNFNSIKHEENVSCLNTSMRSVNSFTKIQYSCFQSDNSTLTSIADISSQTTTVTQINTNGGGSGNTNKVASIQSTTTTTEATTESYYPSNTATIESDDDGGTTAGIIIGVILVIIAAIVIIVFALRRKRQNDSLKSNATAQESTIHLTNNPGGSAPSLGTDENGSPGDGYSHVGLRKLNIEKNNSNKVSSEDTYNHIDELHPKQSTSSNNTYNHIGVDNSRSKASIDDNYNHVGVDKTTTKALPEDAYNHIRNSDWNVSPNDTYNHIGGDNPNVLPSSDDTYNHVNATVSSDDTYNHIRDDNSNIAVSSDDTYDHVRGDDSNTMTSSYDTYNHIKSGNELTVSNNQQNTTDYNHIELTNIS